MRKWIGLVVLLQAILPHTMHAQVLAAQMDKVYTDESHCLVAPEIRSSKDNPVSCYCRDAIADARYVYFSYLLSGKDRNLNGTFLALQRNATEMCGLDYDAITTATETENWKWSGPEVVRTYPSDKEIARISPDKNGFRLVRYNARLIYRDEQGRTTKAEDFTAVDRIPVAGDSSLPKRPRKATPQQ
jgi:hypothetical protein